jgi:hypothetical protein
MKAIQTVTVGAGGAASISFSNIPQTYTDLVIKFSARSTDAGTVDVVKAQFISGSDANGSYRDVVGQGSSTGSTTGSSYIRFGRITAAGSTTSTFSTNEVYIPNYVGSNYKSYSVDLAREQNSSTDNDVTLMAGLWSNTLPITGMVLLPVLANFAQYSTFTLYGVFNQDVSTAPAVPTIGTATAGGTGTTASVAFTGVSGAASYTATSTPGSFAATGTASPITVSGLTTGTAYTFKVKANNPFGSSAESAASNSVTPVDPGAFVSIATVTASGGESSLNFTSIPGTYKHLQIRGFLLSSSGGGGSMRFNSDTASNYTYHNMGGNGSSVFAYGTTGTMTNFIDTSDGTNPSVVTTDIIDYASTGKFKTLKSITGYDKNAAGGSLYQFSGLWRSTTAITSVQIGVGNFGATFDAGTTFALYGIKG